MSISDSLNSFACQDLETVFEEENGQLEESNPVKKIRLVVDGELSKRDHLQSLRLGLLSFFKKLSLKNCLKSQTNECNLQLMGLKQFKDEASLVIQNVFNNVMRDELSKKDFQILQEAYKKYLPRPGHDRRNVDILVLWRGLTPQHLIGIIKNGSAGGIEPAVKGTKAPTEKEAIAQVGELATLPEFTINSQIARSFGRGNVVAAFKIHKRYLTKGSCTEGGYVSLRQAPIQLLGWQPGAPYVR